MLVLGGALALAACGDDDGGDASVEAFCQELETFASSEDEASFVEDFRAVADAAPSEISDETDQLLAAFEVLAPLTEEPETEEERVELLELIASIEEPTDALYEYVGANCPNVPADAFLG